MSARRFALLTFVGIVLAQGTWILTVPPFRGIDEFDHAFRAAGVAHGQWRATERVTDGRGLVVVVPASLAGAASAQCEWLPNTGQDNCFPIDEVGDGKVTIASSAGTYNPAWYAVVGLPSMVLEGAHALYGMRIVAALICAAGVAASAWCLGLGRPGRWTRFGFLASLTPVLVYSTVIPGPNGPEIVAGLLLWTSLLALFSHDVSGRHDRPLLAMASLAGVALAVLRMLGPMWLGLIVLAVVAVVGVRPVLAAVRRHPYLWVAASALVTLAVVWGTWWSLDGGPAQTTRDISDEARAGGFTLGTKPLAWTLQMIAAFPLRREVAHPLVYLCGGLVISFLVAAGIWKSRGRSRTVLVVLVLSTIALPIVITILTVASQGVIWQGRYQLPFAVGILMVAGWHLDRAAFLSRERGRTMILGATLLAMAHAMSVWGVSAGEVARDVSASDPQWLTLPPVLLGVASFALWLTWCVLATRDDATHGTAPHRSTPGAVPTGVTGPHR